MRLERAVVRRIAAFMTLGLAAGLWLIVRPSVVRQDPLVRLLEFPVAVLVVAILCWIAARPKRAREPPQAPWRRHEQVVRPLTDPEAAPFERSILSWIETGEGAPEAADVLARAVTPDARRREEILARLLPEMREASSRRKREAIVRRAVDAPDHHVAFDVIPDKPTHEQTGA